MFHKRSFTLSGSCGLLLFLSILQAISTPLLQTEKSEPAEVSGGAERLPIKPLKRTLETKPRYTEEARLAGVEGAVVVYAEITKDGSPENLRILRSLGYGLDEEAIRAVQQWRFEPDRENSQLSRVATYVPVRFRLERQILWCSASCKRRKRNLSDWRGRNHCTENSFQGGTPLHRRSPNRKA